MGGRAAEQSGACGATSKDCQTRRDALVCADLFGARRADYNRNGPSPFAALLSVSPRTIDGWVAKRMIPHIEPNPRLHLFDPAAVKSALLAQYAIPAKMPEEVALRAGASGDRS
jgi:hypothetical protein